MSDSDFMAAVQAARAGDAAVLAGFGLERVATAGDRTRESFAVDGAGASVMTTLRSDGSEASGEFRRQLSANELFGLLDLVGKTSFDALRPSVAPPYAMRLELAIVAGGHVRTWQMLAAPEAHVPLSPVLAEIDRLAALARTGPVAAVSIELKLDPLAASATECTGKVRLHNPGTEGLWIVHPACLVRREVDAPYDQLLLEYGRVVPVDPDANPPPMILAREDLKARLRPPSALAWLAPAASFEVDVSSPVALRRGRHLFRATYSSYASHAAADHLAGRRFFRGQATSPDLFIEVV